MRRLRTLAAVATLTFAGLAPSVVAPVVACAAEGGPRAALVVDTGARVLRLCVALDAASVSGIHLIELAGRQHGLQHSFGFGGQAVCSLAGVGVDGGDCFAEYPTYWGYWHGNGRGGWSWASSGAGSAQVGNGDVDGWVWGEGDSASTHDRPPRTRIDDACSAPEPSPEPSPDPSPDLAPVDDGAAGNGGAQPTPSPSERKEPKDRDHPEPTPSVVDSEPEMRASAGTPAGSSDGPPATLYLALVAAAVLVVGGRIRLRRRGAAE